MKEILNNLRSYHIQSIFHNLNIKKIYNILKAINSYIFNKTDLRCYPFIANIDTGNLCNYKCKFCPTGENRKGRKKHMMNLSEYKTVLNKLPYEYFIILYLQLWGEPLLNKDLPEIIKYTKSKNIFCGFSTNLSLMTKKLARQIIENQLDFIVLSLDATTDATYKKFRSGKFESILKNLEILTNTKIKLKSKKPFLEWQFIKFKHNEQEIEIAKNLSKKFEINSFKIIEPYVENKEWLTTKSRREKIYTYKSLINCKRQWSHIAVQADGGVSPCCWVYYQKHDFGNIFSNDFKDIWNNKKYIEARESILNKKYKFKDNVCCNCQNTLIAPFASIEQNENI